MNYEVILPDEVQKQIIKHNKSGNKNLTKKLYDLICEIRHHPREGTGKPERLKGYTTERWSRRIDSRHRLIYEIHDDELIVIAVSEFGHYGDK